MASSTLTHEDQKTDRSHAVNRRQLLIGGTVLGAATLAGTGVAVAEDDQAAPLGPEVLPEAAPDGALAVPSRVAGTEMVSVSPLHGGTYYAGNSPYGSSYGFFVPGANTYISKPLNLPAGSRIVRLHPCGWCDGGT